MNERGDCKQKDVCDLRFEQISRRLDKVEETEGKRLEETQAIREAVVVIQATYQQLATTLSKLELKIEGMAKDPWFTLFEKILLILAGIISALLGQKIM